MLWLWGFMLVVNLLLSVSMMGFGRAFVKSPPKQVNDYFGYRTAMSTTNKDTWVFAHLYFGRIWFVLGIISAATVAVVFILLLGKSIDTVGNVGGVTAIIQCVLLVAPILPTERALRKAFDNRGNRMGK